MIKKENVPIACQVPWTHLVTIQLPGRGDAISRHDRIRDRIASACSAANLSTPIQQLICLITLANMLL